LGLGVVYARQQEHGVGSAQSGLFHGDSRVLRPLGLEPAEALRRFRTPPLRLVLATRVLLSVVCLGATGLLVAHGTYAKFNAVTTSTTNTFQSGTVLMTNAGSSPCTGVSSGSCGTVSLSSNTGMSPGDSGTGTITITNSGSANASMALVASKNASTTTNFNTFLNLTIHDDTSGYCIYGHTSLPYNGSCDDIHGQVSQQSTDAFPSSSTASLSLPNSSGGSSWAAGESHSLTITVQVINNTGTVPTGATGSLDLSWTNTGVGSSQ
jgi:predicted ribosomally synthesized peptide with SipW-like signal peptide